MNAKGLAFELESTLDWRIRKIAEYPLDNRNRVAAEELRRLIAGLRMLGRTAAVEQWDKFYETLLRDDDAMHSFCIGANEYRSRIGFSAFPLSAKVSARADGAGPRHACLQGSRRRR